MSADVFGKLKTLHDEVRARIEATQDWKALVAVERALGEVKALLPVEARADDAAAEAIAEAAIEQAEAAVDATEEAAVADAADTIEEAAAPAEAGEASASNIAEIPAEHQALVEEIVATVPGASAQVTATRS